MEFGFKKGLGYNTNMEILKETVEQITFVLPTTNTTSVSATYSTDGVTEVAMPVTTANGVATGTVPYQPNEGTVRVTWTFTIPGSGTFTKVENYTVVAPYLSTQWIKSNLLETATDAEIRDAERAARYIVQAHTGQFFGRETSTKRAWGAQNNALSLPARLLSMTAINGNADTDFYIMGDGWYLSRPSWTGIPPIKADAYGVNEATVPIIDPYARRGGVFIKNVPYDITGTWGWEAVPEAVVEAMKLLVNDYACADAQYRDRYLTSMTAADWRIQFYNGAFMKTGNVRADQLLSDYVLQRGWAVI